MLNVRPPFIIAPICFRKQQYFMKKNTVDLKDLLKIFENVKLLGHGTNKKQM